MRCLWVHRVIDAPATDLWRLLVDLDAWPDWGPSLRAATIDADRLGPGVRGTATLVTRGSVPFEITDFEDGRRWAWKVAGLPATDHVVHELDPGRCRVGFGVPWPAAPYLAVCRVALRRLASLAAQDPVAP